MIQPIEAVLFSFVQPSPSVLPRYFFVHICLLKDYITHILFYQELLINVSHLIYFAVL